MFNSFSLRFSEESTAKWLSRFEGTGVPCGPINTIQQVFSDPQVRFIPVCMFRNNCIFVKGTRAVFTLLLFLSFFSPL